MCASLGSLYVKERNGRNIAKNHHKTFLKINLKTLFSLMCSFSIMEILIGFELALTILLYMIGFVHNYQLVVLQEPSFVCMQLAN